MKYLKLLKQLTSDPGDDELSRAEEDLLFEVFAAHGHKNRWVLVDELHQLPEWTDPRGSMVPISIHDILVAVGKSRDEVIAIEQQMAADAFAASLFHPQ